MPTLDLFRTVTDAASCAAGQTMCSTGAPGHLIYVVQVGEVRIVVGDPRRATAGPGAIIGAPARIDQAMRSATATALRACHAFPLRVVCDE